MSNKLLFIKPDLNLNEKLSIVGSSGSLNGSKLGSKIDMSVDVITFNTATTKNFEEDVGSKTTYRAVNNVVFDNNDLSKKGYTGSKKNFIKKLRNNKIIYIGPDQSPWENRNKNSHKSNELFLFDYDKIPLIKKYLNCSFSQNLQIGTIVIATCLMSGLTPTIYGFDLSEKKRTHYYENRPSDFDRINHNVIEENIAIKKLIESGKIKYIDSQL